MVNFYAALGENCIPSIIGRNFGLNFAFKAFNDLQLLDNDKFCNLLLSDGQEWFEDVRISKGVFNQWSIVCNRYETASYHDAKRNLHWKAALKLVRQKRRSLFKKFTTFMKDDENLVIFRSNGNKASLTSTIKIIDTIHQMKSNVVFLFSQKSDDQDTLKILFGENYINLEMPKLNEKYKWQEPYFSFYLKEMKSHLSKYFEIKKV